MPSTSQPASLQALSQFIEALGPISEDTLDRWSGKRAHPRRDLIVPVRLTPLGESENPRGPVFTVRSRDISDNGLGLIYPYEIEYGQHFEVEIISEEGAWQGRMQLVHCTQTVGGYKLGLRYAPGTAEPVLSGSAETEVDPCTEEDEHSDILTVEQAQAEVCQALRRYQLAEATWGLFGARMEWEIKRILNSLPPPLESRLKLEPRRSDYRHEVEGHVHLLVSGEDGQTLVTTRIADLSAGGARLVLSPDQADAPWPSGSPAAVGIWTAENGTLWLPARIVHDGSPLLENKSVGLQFVRQADLL